MMPNFELIITGATVVPWTDTATPSRLNPRSGHTMLRYLAHVGDTVTLTASVGGTSAPLDSSLSGRLFYPTSWEYPTAYPVSFVSPVGQSSIMSFVVAAVGHYLLGVRFTASGSVFVHVDVEAPP
jgi:hypothetical protein